MERVVDLPFEVRRPILACGADIKGAFALAKGKRAVLVEGFGDLGELDNLTRYERTIRQSIKRHAIKPAIIACDLHPDYLSTRFAERFQLQSASGKLCRVQHHEAHIASAIIDNGIKGKVIGVAFDGTGFGTDGAVWGGEFFVGNSAGFRRIAHLEYMTMPGGELAVRQPWRMAASYLYNTFESEFLQLKIDFIKKFRKKCQAPFMIVLTRGVNSPLTSSAGRLFDAAGSIVLAKGYTSREAELPMELERLAYIRCGDAYKFEITSAKGVFLIKAAGIIKGIIKDLSGSIDKKIISAKFHNSLAGIIAKTSLAIRKETGIRKVALSGGVFQNKYLVAGALKELRNAGFEPYIHCRIPAYDAGIPIGQVAIADKRAVCV